MRRVYVVERSTGNGIVTKPIACPAHLDSCWGLTIGKSYQDRDGMTCAVLTEHPCPHNRKHLTGPPAVECSFGESPEIVHRPDDPTAPWLVSGPPVETPEGTRYQTVCCETRDQAEQAAERLSRGEEPLG